MLFLPINKTLLCTGLFLATIFLAVPRAKAQSSDYLNIQALLDDVQKKHQYVSLKLYGYTFTLRRIEQQLDNKGRVKKETVKVFQVFPVHHAMPVMVLLSENGKNLSSARLADEKARANNEWRKRKKASRKVAGQKEQGEMLSFFQTSEFSMSRTEKYKDRDIIVLSFKPRDNLKPSTDSEKFVSKLEGEVWVDALEKSVVKVDARLAENYKVGGVLSFFSFLKPGTSLVIENSRLSDELWVTTSVKFAPLQKVSFFAKGVPDVQIQELSEYKPFDKEADSLY